MRSQPGKPLRSNDHHEGIGKSHRTELLILSDWVAERLPAGEPPATWCTGDGSSPPCLKCGGRRSGKRKRNGVFAHKCPLSGRRSADECKEACAVCAALLPIKRRPGHHEQLCRVEFPDLWKDHHGPAVVPLEARSSKLAPGGSEVNATAVPVLRRLRFKRKMSPRGA